MNLSEKIRVIDDYPVKGISFKDVTTLLKDAKAFKQACDEMTDLAKEFKFDYVLSPEARGFLFGPIIAANTGAGFIPIRKPGKLPAQTVSQEYELEYGTDRIEMHADALKKGDRVLIVDDLLATGGTTSAIVELVKRQGAEVAGLVYLIELTFIDVVEDIKKYPTRTVIKY